MALRFDSGESPEKKLLLYCARTRMPAAVAAAARSILAGVIDWDLLRAEATVNSITPLVERQLLAVSPPEAKAEVDQWKVTTRANAGQTLQLVAELIKIEAALSAQSILAIPCKGPVVAMQAYGNVALREFDDLDIILRQRDMPLAHATLVRLGYEARFPSALTPSVPGAPIPGEYKYFNASLGAIVELHTEQTLRHFPSRPDLDDLATRLVSVSLSGHELLTFAPEDALPILCIHGSKDFWSRISWMADIAEMIQSHPALDWDQVFMRAESLRASRMLHVGLLLAAHLLDADVPEKILARAENDKTAADLASDISRGTLSPGGYAVASGAERFRYRRRMVGGTLAGLGYAARLAVAAAGDSWHNLPQLRSHSAV